MITKDLRVGLSTYATQVPVAWEKLSHGFFIIAQVMVMTCAMLYMLVGPSADLNGAAPGCLGLCCGLSSHGADRAEPHLFIPFFSL
jgi:hypothetical protein